jgi:hypothetical protein
MLLHMLPPEIILLVLEHLIFGEPDPEAAWSSLKSFARTCHGASQLIMKERTWRLLCIKYFDLVRLEDAYHTGKPTWHSAWRFNRAWCRPFPDIPRRARLKAAETCKISNADPLHLVCSSVRGTACTIISQRGDTPDSKGISIIDIGPSQVSDRSDFGGNPNFDIIITTEASEMRVSCVPQSPVGHLLSRDETNGRWKVTSRSLPSMEWRIGESRPLHLASLGGILVVMVAPDHVNVLEGYIGSTAGPAWTVEFAKQWPEPEERPCLKMFKLTRYSPLRACAIPKLTNS